MSGFQASDVPDQSGRTFIVTGSNTGIGREIANILAKRGARVLLACRSEEKAREAMALIARAAPDADLAFLPLDLADLDSVRAAADQAEKEARLDGLINNAGVMFPPLSHTAQGFELQFGVNHLGHFALTGLLLPKLTQTPGSRVVVTSSLAHRRGTIQWDDLKAEQSYKKGQRYSDSKFANMLHFAELDRRLRAAGSPVTALGCHPGVAATDLMRHAGPFKVVTPLFGAILNTSAQGAWPALQAATDPDIVPGGYYGPQQLGESRGPSGIATRTEEARDEATARRLWDLSVELTGVDPQLK